MPANTCAAARHQDDGVGGETEDATEPASEIGVEMAVIKDSSKEEEDEEVPLSFGKSFTGWLRLNGWIHKGDLSKVYTQSLKGKAFASVVNDMLGTKAMESWFDLKKKEEDRHEAKKRGGTAEQPEDEADDDESEEDDGGSEPALCPTPFLTIEKYKPAYKQSYGQMDGVRHKQLLEELLIDMDDEATVELDNVTPNLSQKKPKGQDGKNKQRNPNPHNNAGRQLWLLPKPGQSTKKDTPLLEDEIDATVHPPTGKNGPEHTSFSIALDLYDKKSDNPSDDLWRMVAAPGWNALGILYDKARIALNDTDYLDPLARDNAKATNYQETYFKKVQNPSHPAKYKDRAVLLEDARKAAELKANSGSEVSDDDPKNARIKLGKTAVDQWIDVKLPIDCFVYPAQILFHFVSVQEQTLGDEEYLDLYRRSFRPDAKEDHYERKKKEFEDQCEECAAVPSIPCTAITAVPSRPCHHDRATLMCCGASAGSGRMISPTTGP